MTTRDELPEVLEAYWDYEQIDTLFHDLSQGAVVSRVQVRYRSDGGIEDTAMKLEQAHRLFLARDAKAIQIWYEFENTKWCDTLMMQPDAVHIIRSVAPDGE